MRTAAIVVVFQPELRMIERLLTRVSGQVDDLIVVDNSPNENDFRSIILDYQYLHFPENLGIAGAHNQGLVRALSSGCDYALLLDQDSQIAGDMVFRLTSLMVASNSFHHNIAAIGPRIHCSFTDKKVRARVQRQVFDYEELVGVTQIIASGMLIDLNCLDEVGLKDERLFIDGVDHEWCWRAKIHGYHVALAKQVEMVHRLGDARHKFVGVTYKVGAPLRLYYQFRNILLLSRRGYVPLYWKIRNLSLMPGRFVVNSMVEKDRGKRLKYMLLGIWHGILGRQGKIS